MLAIHNTSCKTSVVVSVANAYAKLSKCQQFTTSQQCNYYLYLLQTLMQSYQNVSNSQLISSPCHSGSSCKRLCKVIKMLAIHNQSSINISTFSVANAYAKLSKCQQFTTILILKPSHTRLQTLMQSYQNVSNSQLTCFSYIKAFCCKRLCKVIKMLAIHNHSRLQISAVQVANAYAKLSKCQQFTTTFSFIMF